MQNFKKQAAKTQEKIFQGKINFFSKKITHFVNFGTLFADMFGRDQKISGCLKIMRSEQLLFQRSKRKNNCGRASGEFELQFQRS